MTEYHRKVAERIWSELQNIRCGTHIDGVRKSREAIAAILAESFPPVVHEEWCKCECAAPEREP